MPVYGQYYVNGLANTEIDSFPKQYDYFLKQDNFKKALACSNRLLEYWSHEKTTSNDLNVKNNFYYSFIINNKAKSFIPPKDYKLLIDKIRPLEQDILRDFNSEYPLLGIYYELMGDFYRKLKTEIEKAEFYYLKAAKINATLPETYNKYKSNTISRLGNISDANYKLDEALKYFEEALELSINSSPIDSLGLIYTYYQIGRTYQRKNQPERCPEYWKKSLAVATSHLKEGHKMIRGIRHALAGNLYNTGKYEESIVFLETILEKERNLYGETVELGRWYNLLAKSLNNLGRKDEALEVHLINLHNFKQENSFYGIADIYNGLAATSTSLSDIINYLTTAIDLCPKDPRCDAAHECMYLRNLSTTYGDRGDYNSAINYLNKAMEVKDLTPNEAAYTLPKIYTSLSRSHFVLGDINQAKKYASKAIEIERAYKSDDKQKIAYSLANLADLHIYENDFDSAERLLSEALNLLKGEPTTRWTGFTYQQMGNLYAAKKMEPKAILYYNKAKEAFLGFLGSESTYLNETLLSIALVYKQSGEADSCQLLIQEVLNNCGFSTFEKGKINQYKIGRDDLWTSFSAFAKCIELDSEITDEIPAFLIEKIETGNQLIDELKSSFYFESSEIEFQKQTRSFYNWSLSQLSKLYEKDQSDQTLSSIFKCIEKSKSISTHRALERDKSLAQGLITEEMLQKEKRIMIDYESAFQLYLNQKSNENDSITKALADKMFDLEKDKNDLLAELAENFPAYFKKRYEQNVVTLEDAESLAHSIDKAIISYHWSDSIVYRFVITPNSTSIELIPIEPMKPSIEGLQKLLYGESKNHEINYLANKTRFINCATKLHRALLEMESDIKIPEEVIIIPSGPLTQIPFECLISASVDSLSPYKSLPYFLRNHIVGYIGSITQLAHLQRTERARNENEYLGFGPDFFATKNLTNVHTRSDNNLLYNVEEITRTSQLFKGTHYIGELATEKAFNENASNYRMLHLAMHAKVNDLIPHDSYLSFASDSFPIDDGLLQFSEIAKMDLNNDLVVLSACETNVGEKIFGEGILGISRAFQLASCHNIVMSNWLVDDRSSSTLIISFFKGIKNQIKPAEALRNAKLEFIENSSVIHSNPAYWAAFSYYGNSENLPLHQSGGFGKWWVIGAVLVLFGLLGFYFKV